MFFRGRDGSRDRVRVHVVARVPVREVDISFWSGHCWESFTEMIWGVVHVHYFSDGTTLG